MYLLKLFAHFPNSVLNVGAISGMLFWLCVANNGLLETERERDSLYNLVPKAPSIVIILALHKFAADKVSYKQKFARAFSSAQSVLWICWIYLVSEVF